MANETSNRMRSRLQLFLTIFATLAALGALWRMFDESAAKRLDATTLLYLGVAGALLLLQDVKSFAFGDYKVEFDRRINEIETKVDNAQANAIGVGKAGDHHLGDVRTPATVTPKADGLESLVMSDPQKGKFGGQNVSGSRELVADVVRIGTSDLFRVRLQVRSTDQRRDPLRGAVQYFLHPTFSNPEPIVTASPAGIAEVNLTAWGAFTVGAVTDNGKTRLELDLSRLDTAPEDFRNR